MINRRDVFLTLATVATLSLTTTMPSVAQRGGQNNNKGENPDAQNPMTVTQGVPQRGAGNPNQNQDAPLPPGVKTTFVHLGNGEPAVLYEPVNPGPKAQIAIFTMHSAGDELTTSTCTELSKRGYRVFCVNNSNDKSRNFNDGVLDQVNLETKKAVAWLRKYPGVKKIVLWGHSGGSTVATSYQDIAENGVKACQDDVHIWKCPNSLADMPPADGIILGDANWGIANDVLTATDPSVTMDNGIKIVHPELDMFNPANGFNPAGSHYSPEFIHKFLVAQGKKNNEMIDLALKKYADIKAGEGDYDDDEPFFVAGSLFTQNKLYTSDMSLLNHTQKPWPLLHPDGSITTEIIHSVRVPTTNANPSHSFYAAALKTTVTGYLSTYAIRVDPDKYGYGPETAESGVIWRSSRASLPGNVEGITVPVLTMGMTGSFEMGAAETIHNHAKSTDKTLIYVEGASHGYPTCKACEKTPGQYGDTVKTIYDYADTWLSKPGRFM
jgi:hypothetical protein